MTILHPRSKMTGFPHGDWYANPELTPSLHRWHLAESIHVKIKVNE
jgi:hypothetical protein